MKAPASLLRRANLVIIKLLANKLIEKFPLSFPQLYTIEDIMWISRGFCSPVKWREIAPNGEYYNFVNYKQINYITIIKFFHNGK